MRHLRQTTREIKEEMFPDESLEEVRRNALILGKEILTRKRGQQIRSVSVDAVKKMQNTVKGVEAQRDKIIEMENDYTEQIDKHIAAERYERVRHSISLKNPVPVSVNNIAYKSTKARSGVTKV